MLANAIPLPTDSTNLMLQSIFGPSMIDSVETGIYILNHWNFEHEFHVVDPHTWDSDSYFSYKANHTELSSYGVCDSIEQWKEAYAEVINHPTRNFCVSLVAILKSEQESRGGWRWHKWGPYIGTQNPRCEYLHDEPEIEKVFTFRVYEVPAPLTHAANM